MQNLKSKLSRILKLILYGTKGEALYINNTKLYFIEGSRPLKYKYLNSENDTNRNDVLQTEYFKTKLTSNSIFYDIGSHFGTYSMIASAYISNQNSIFAFEPDKKAMLVLKNNLSNNLLTDKIIVSDFAVSSFTGELNFDMQDGNANSHIVTNSELHFNKKLSVVKSICLNDLIKIYPKPTLIKIDTEGAEIDIIKGASELLNDHSIHFICELHPFAWEWYKDANWGEFVKIVKNAGRKITVLDSKKNETDLPFYGTILF